MGTWERTINDFFAFGIGSLLPALIVVGVGLLLYLRALDRSAPVRPSLSWAFAICNVLFIILLSNAMSLATALNDSFLPPRAPNEIGYHRDWPAIAVTVALSILLLLVQWKTASRLQRTNLVQR